jgi:tetratricopeptide (TPR) repeat protein
MLCNSHQWDDAISYFRRVIEIDRQFRFGYWYLADSLRNKGQLDEAIAVMREAIRLKKDDADAHDCLGNALRDKGRLDEAIEEYREAIRLKKDDARFSLGLALATKGQLDEAIAELREVIRLKKNNPFNHNGLAWLLATCRDVKFRNPSQAVTHARKAVELAPYNAMFWFTLGVAQYRNGDWKAGIEALMKSAQLRDGVDSFEFFFLAMAHWQLGEKDEARAWYDRAVAWMDKNRPQHEGLKRFRAEATALLGMEKAVQTQKK